METSVNPEIFYELSIGDDTVETVLFNSRRSAGWADGSGWRREEEEKESREANTKEEAINIGQTGGISSCRSNLYSSREDKTQTTEKDRKLIS